MNTVRWFCTGLHAVVITSVSVGWLAGCGGSPKQQAATPPDEAIPPLQTTVTPIAARDMNLPVKEGMTPMAYIVETTGGLMIVDETTGRNLTKTMVPGQSIVSIDEQHGLSISGTVVVQGPLPADHRYGIYVNADGFEGKNEIRTSNERTDPDILRKSNQSSGKQVSGATTGPSPHN